MNKNTSQGYMGEGFADVHANFRPLPIGLRGNVTGHFFVKLFGLVVAVNADVQGNPRPCEPKTRAAAAKLIRPAILKLIKAVEKRAEEQKKALAESKKPAPKPAKAK